MTPTHSDSRACVLINKQAPLFVVNMLCSGWCHITNESMAVVWMLPFCNLLVRLGFLLIWPAELHNQPLHNRVAGLHKLLCNCCLCNYQAKMLISDGFIQHSVFAQPINASCIS